MGLWRRVSVSSLLWLLVACQYEQELNGVVYCSEGNPESFNPQLVTSSTTLDATSNQLYNRLVEYLPQQGTIMPSLAIDWQVSDDGLRYVFTLRDKVQFHQQPYFKPTRFFNADDVLFSFQRLLDVEHPFHQVSHKGYPFFESIAFRQTVAKVEKIADNQVAFILNSPDATFLANLSSAFAVILSAEYGAQLIAEKQLAAIDLNPIGTGPFKLITYVKNDHIRYKSHQQYWDGEPELENLVFDITPKSSIRLTKLLTGDCHVSALPKSSELPVLEKYPEVSYHAYPSANVAYWAFNTQKPPFDNLQVRQALALAVDQQKLLQVVYQRSGESASGVLPPTSWAFNSQLPVKDFDPKRARELLAQAGIENLTLEIWAMPVERAYNPNSLKTAQLIQADLAKIDVKVNIVSYGWSVFTDKLEDSDYDTVLLGWSADNHDPDNFFTPILSCGAVPNGNNRARWCDPHFDQLIEQAKIESEQKQRIALYQTAEQYMLSQAPLMPIAHGHRQILTRGHVSPFSLMPSDGISFAQRQTRTQRF